MYLTEEAVRRSVSVPVALRVSLPACFSALGIPTAWFVYREFLGKLMIGVSRGQNEEASQNPNKARVLSGPVPI